VRFIDEPTLLKNISSRMEIYQEASKDKPIVCYINIGGGIASIGGSQNQRLIPAGVTQHLAVKNFPVRAVINQMAERGLPVINISNIEKIAVKYGIPTDVSGKEPELGEGPIFFKDRYSISDTIFLTSILAVVVFVGIRIDVKHYLTRRKLSIPETHV
jgi:hypothetical protein